MPSAHVVIESPIESSFRVEQIRGMFDVPDRTKIRHEWNVVAPVEDRAWAIGLIVGPSGSGKTTLGRRLFPDAKFHEGYDWPETQALVDGFPECLDGKSITQALSSVGFSSPPHWLKRFSHLSNGQKFRCELARLMLDESSLVVFDEFTSVIDRDTAKISSAAIAKAIRRQTRQRFVALSCHYDVVDWLDPDWVLDTASMTFAWRSLQGRPPIRLDIHQADRKAWSMFEGHHYLTRSVSSSAQCFVAAWNDSPVGFTSYVHSVGHFGIKREHRTVVLPDYQGVGIGNRLSEWLGDHLRSQGWRFTSSTSHPAMIQHRAKSEMWSMRSCGRQSVNAGQSRNAAALRKSGSASRITGVFEYLGPPRSRANPRVS